MRTSAPGKLFLIGEYAVLEGGPALLAPVRQRARVSINPTLQSKVVTNTTASREYSVTEALRSLPLLKTTISELGYLKQIEGATLTLDTSDFFRGDVKLGLGSSAALVVALVKLLAPKLGKQEHLQTSIQCHAAFQKGIGSGADIALATEDTAIVFQLGQPPTPVHLPSDLHMLAIWSGVPASTTKYVSAVKAWQKYHPRNYRKKINELTNIATELVESLSERNSSQFLTKIEEYDRGLEHLSKLSRTDFYNEAHKAMRKKVEFAHCQYKPSGAGGGDFGIACSTEKNELLTLAKSLKQEHRYTFFL